MRIASLLLIVASIASVTHAASAAKPLAPRRTAAQPHVTPPPSAARAGSRTLDDIHIEGEIPVPQVLFITAREQRRFMEFQHERYLRTSRQLGEATPLPSRVVLNRVAPTQAKETHR